MQRTGFYVLYVYTLHNLAQKTDTYSVASAPTVKGTVLLCEDSDFFGTV